MIADELARIREPGVFIVDDVAFVHARHGFQIGEAIMRRGIRKQYYLETRGDVLLRNIDVFRFWRELGLKIMFIGLEAIDEEGLQRFRKRINLDRNMEALEAAVPSASRLPSTSSPTHPGIAHASKPFGDGAWRSQRL